MSNWNAVAKRILVVGSATCDIFIECRPEDVTDAILDGIKVDIAHLRYVIGGGCINAARIFTRFGFDVLPVFKLGKDQTAQVVLSKIRASGITVKYGTFSENAPTGTSFIIPTPSGSHTIFTYRGANEQIEPPDLPLDTMTVLDGIYLAPLVGASTQLLSLLIQYAEKAHIPLLHNPSSFELLQGWKMVAAHLEHLPICLLNKREAEQFGRHLDGDTPFDVATFCKKLHARGVKTIIITYGKTGTYLSTGTELVFHPSIKLTAVNTVGAGDTFGATFLSFVVAGFSHIDALRAGMLQSAAHLQSKPLLSHEAITESLAKSEGPELKVQRL